MASPRDWAMGSTVRAAMVMGALFGGVQVVRAVLSGHGAVGVGVSVITGVAFGAFMGLFFARMTRDLSGLTPDERSQVSRAVRLGEAPSNASLAPATVAWARRVQEENAKHWPYVVLGGFAVLAAVSAAADALAGSLTAEDVILVVFWLLFLPLLRWSATRRSDRARQAEFAARRIAETDV